jgi:EAL domain-containing protein (putative c-di-GMP-specific phosphodiesterase class I)
VSPIEFVQLAEQSGLITQLTDQVLATAIRTARRWFEAGYDLGVAVNLSAHDLLDERLPQRIGQLLEQYGMPADRLTLEITESALLSDTPRTTRTIDRLEKLGVRLSLDDFGTGYSSLGYLRRVPVAELKVDQSFVKDLLLDDQDETIVRSTIDLGHSLGLQVVAEGIENLQVLQRLQDLSCDIGQGYAISRPLSPDRFATWLRTTNYKSKRRASSVWAETIQMPDSRAKSSAMDRTNVAHRSM